MLASTDYPINSVKSWGWNFAHLQSPPSLGTQNCGGDELPEGVWGERNPVKSGNKTGSGKKSEVQVSRELTVAGCAAQELLIPGLARDGSFCCYENPQ